MKKRAQNASTTATLPKSIKTQLDKLDGWIYNEKTNEISKIFTLTTYLNALAFVAKVAVHAEIIKHHPRIVLSYNSVEVFCTTHDAGTITKLDIDLAKKIQQIKTYC